MLIYIILNKLPLYFHSDVRKNEGLRRVVIKV